MMDSVSCDPYILNVAQLKEKLKAVGAPTSGTKAELISRLVAIDPSGAGTHEIGRSSEAGENEDDEQMDDGNALSHMTMRSTTNGFSSEANLQRELELIRREKEVLERELQVARREVELLRVNASGAQRLEHGMAAINTSTAGININTIADLLPSFEGKGEFFDRWERQVLFLRGGYKLDDHTTKVLIATRLKGRALEWFHSKAEHIQMTAGCLLMAMRTMFARRQQRVAARKQFEERVWKRGEDFIDYFHDKTILANRVPIDDDELVDYLIDGIPDQILRDQARIQDFGSAAALLRAFEKITLQQTTNTPGGRTPIERSQEPRRSDGERSGVVRCFGCGQPGHVSARCPLKVRGLKCFRCNEFGHIAAKCTKASAKEANSVGVPKPVRGKCYKSVQIAGRDVLAVMDTGSDICLMRAEPYVRIGAPRLQECEVEFRGVGSVSNVALGKFYETLTIDGDAYRVTIHVVADDLMEHDLLIGSDFLNSVDVTMREGQITVSRPSNGSDNAESASVFMIDVPYEVNRVDSTYIVRREINDESPSTEKGNEVKSIDRVKDVKKAAEQSLETVNDVRTLEEKLDVMCKKYSEIVDDNKRLLLNLKELENLCHELQEQNKAVKEECLLRLQREEEERKEVSAKLKNTLVQINASMNLSLEKMERMSQKILVLEKETSLWKQRWERSHSVFFEMAEEETAREYELANDYHRRVDETVGAVCGRACGRCSGQHQICRRLSVRLGGNAKFYELDIRVNRLGRRMIVATRVEFLSVLGVPISC